jgi:hypothetical protein
MPYRFVQHGGIDVGGPHYGDRDACPLSKFGDIPVISAQQPVRAIKPLSVPRAWRYWHNPLCGNGKCATAADTVSRVNKPLCAFGGISADLNPDPAAIQGDDTAQKLTT